MGNLTDRNGEFDLVYPPIEPFDRKVLPVGGGHRIYLEQCGSPSGAPVVVLHGGPGGGCSPMMRRFFDPAVYRAVLFDQRGCGRSTPHGSVECNTTGDLVDDIERIREALGIERWIVFGGSWGAALGLLYAEAHPERVAHMVLRGVFLMTAAELDWFYGGGAARFWPERWAEFVAPIPENERENLVAAYHARLFCGDPGKELKFARSWFDWENGISTMAEKASRAGPSRYVHAFARLECHYFINNGFLEADGQIMERIGRIADLPGDIIQGRYDMVCPPSAAAKLAANWPKGRLRMVPDAGHASSEPGIASALTDTMNELRGNLPRMGM